MSLLCTLFGHKYEVSIIDPDWPQATCVCGGWKMFHKNGVAHNKKGKTPGDCGNFKLGFVSWVNCTRCHKHFNLKHGWNKLYERTFR